LHFENKPCSANHVVRLKKKPVIWGIKIYDKSKN
jgi:hypothetical protein